MLFFSNEKDYKNLASALRRELGLTDVSHNQMLEAVAKSMGHKSYAALLATKPAAPAAPVAPAAPQAPVYSYPFKPVQVYGYSGEKRFLAQLKKYKAYRLFNDEGELDLTKSGDLAEGIGLAGVNGTLDDIRNCTCLIEGARRSKAGNLKPVHAGETDVNWDGQVTRTDTRGVDLYVDRNYEGVPADTLFLVPEGCAGADGGEAVNLLSEEVAEEHDFAVRSVLVEACMRWIVDKGLTAAALEELVYDEDWGGFSDEFAEYADAIGEPGTKDVSVLGQAQWVAGFQMHVREFKALRNELLALVKAD